MEIEKPFYVTSDQHFFHANIMKYCSREFSSVEQMNEVMFTNWNKTISENDLVFFLGDFVCGHAQKYQIAQYLYDHLNGEKIFLRGNHDKNLEKFTNIPFQKQKLEIEYNGLRILLSHRPVWNFTQDLHIFGHIHNNKENMKLEYNMFNACVEMNDYLPISIENIILRMTGNMQMIYQQNEYDWW